MERIGQTIEDKRGTIRTLYRDGLGRQTNDCVTTNGSGTDVTVKQIITAYEVRGMVATVTSTDSASQGAGTVLNQVQLTYNTFAQLTQEEQSHSGTVGSAPSVYYYYDTGGSGSNEIRLNQLKYPNGRVLTYNFASGMDATLNRVTSISDTSATLASYTYLGLGTVVRIAYPQPSVWLDLWGGTSGVFNGLDLFNRIIDQRWQNNTGGTPVDIDRYQYGYSYNSNRLWKANVVGTAALYPSPGLDELYQYDNINRLLKMQRGTLNSGKTAITGTIAREMDYTLDPTGNWTQYASLTTGSPDFTQTRTSNAANEITAIASISPPSTPPTAWITPAYDDAGNMTTMPRPATPTSSFTATYDAWNRMTEIDSGGSPVGQYQYDGRNRRIVAVTTDTRHFYFTNDWQDIEQRVGSSTSMDQQHVWGIRYIDELVCRDDATPQRLYACQDAIFSVTAVTDVSGVPVERFVYDPYGPAQVFGGSWSPTSDALSWTRRFTRQQWDAPTGVYLYRSRYIHPGIGVFPTRDVRIVVPGERNFGTSRGSNLGSADPLDTWLWKREEFGDRILPDAGVTLGRHWITFALRMNDPPALPAVDSSEEYGDGSNLYQYCSDNPINNMDSSGNVCVCSTGGAAGITCRPVGAVKVFKFWGSCAAPARSSFATKCLCNAFFWCRTTQSYRCTAVPPRTVWVPIGAPAVFHCP